MNRARRALAVAGGVVVVTLAAFWLWIKSVESSRWARLEQRVAELRREADQRHASRPVLRADAVPGDAWDDYLQAIKMVDGIAKASSLLRITEGGTPEQRAAGEALLNQYGDAVDLMRKGTRRTTARRMKLHVHEIPETLSNSGTPLGYASIVGMLAVARARLLSEQSRHREAADLLLDACWFASDIDHDGSAMAQLHGEIVLNRAIDEIQDRLSAGLWPEKELSRIAGELGEIEKSLPRWEEMARGELEWLGELILSDRLIPHWFRDKPFPPEGRPGWRHAYSMRLLMTSGFDMVDGAIGRLKDLDAGPWPEESKRFREVNKEFETSRNVVTALQSAIYTNQGRRTMLCRLRLLRAGLQDAATGEILVLDDPYGTKLLHRRESGRLTLWSVGSDGIDDQGTGGWGLPRGKDIVLTVRRAGR